jgi:hypothetical protein
MEEAEPVASLLVGLHDKVELRHYAHRVNLADHKGRPRRILEEDHSLCVACWSMGITKKTNKKKQKNII